MNEQVVVLGPLKTFACGSNAGGGEGVYVRRGDGQREKVYRYVTRSVGGRPRDTNEETEEYRALRALGLL